jgi:two-component system, OmpR family, KDP operon response regulator KdpE
MSFFARIRVALRHQLHVHGEHSIFRVNDLSVDLVRRIVKVGQRDVNLSPKEYDLLRVLVQHAGLALTREFLLGKLLEQLHRRSISSGICASSKTKD